MADIQSNGGNGARVEVPPSGVVAAQDRRTDFMVRAHPSDVSNYARDGNDLVLHLRDGGAIRIQGFFAHGVDFNHLVFVDGGNALPVDFSSALTPAGDGIDDAQVITGAAATPSGGMWLPVLGALAVGAVGVGSLNGGGSDTPPPTQPGVTVPDAPQVALLNDTGVAGDKITSDGRLNLGGIETGATVAYSTDGGKTWAASFTPVEGVNAVQVRQTDAAGHVSAATAFSFTLDTHVAAPTVALLNDTGVAGDKITSDGRLNLSGIETGATVGYSTDGGKTWAASFTPVEGVNAVQVRQTDAAGNVSAATAFSFTLDTHVAAPTVALLNDTGSSNSDKITSDGRLNVSGIETGATLGYSTDGGKTWSASFTPVEGVNEVQVRQTDAAGNVSAATDFSFTLDTQVTQVAAPQVALLNDTGVAGDKITSDGRLNVSGIETGATLGYSTDGGKTWSASFTPVEGANEVQVRQTDVAGNVSAATDFSFTLDTQVAAPQVALLNDTGIAGDKITSDGRLNLSGIETGATAGESTDGGKTWLATFTPAEGVNDVLVRQTDVAGNVSAATDFGFTLEPQGGPPETVATILTLGSYQSGGFTPIPNGTGTTDTAPQIVGELSAPLGADEQVVVLRNGEPIGTASVSGTDWAYTDHVPAYTVPASGNYLYTALVEDAAGNSGPVSDNYKIAVTPGAFGSVFSGWAGSELGDTVTLEDIQTAVASPQITNGLQQDGSTVIGWPRSSSFILDGYGGNDTFNLQPGHAFVPDHAILKYNLIDPNDPTGGNGSDVVNGFVIGNINTNANADEIDLSDLLSTVTGNHGDHVSVTTSGANTLVAVDLKGDGAFATVLTMNNVHTTLAELTANHQIVV
jgi:hypothetical protein